MTLPREDFLDVRSHGFSRVAVCVPEVRVANPAFNAAAHVQQLNAVYDRGAHYAVCPELGLSGYTCGDLFFQAALVREALTALETVARASSAWNMIISVGLPLVVDGLLFISAVTLYRGRVVAAVPKAHLANYREYYEARWFHPATAARSTSIRLLGQEVPFGTDLLLRATHLDNFVLHVEVCEDLWVPVSPSSLATLAGATVLANLSASNITVGKWEYRRDLVRSASARNLAVQLYSAAGFGESTSDLAWDGQGLIGERGELLAETERFALTGSSVVADVDLEAIRTDRLQQTSFGANASGFRGHAMRVIELGDDRDERDAGVYRRFHRLIRSHPFVPSDPAKRDIRCREVFLIQATSLARRILALPAESRRLVLGISGGQDSTHALLVAAHALDLCGLERSRIIAMTMPGFGTTDRTRGNALRLIRAIGATGRELPIVGLSESVFEAIGHPPAVEDLTFENVQAWLRKLLLFATASQQRGIDVGTGDLSEIALGWCTYGGDHMSHYGVNAGVPKTLISFLIHWAAEVVFRDEAEVGEVLRNILATPISPELRRPQGGEITQRSEELIGPYELHDFFLYHFLRFGMGPQRIARLALEAFAGRYRLADIRTWLIVFLTRFFANQFKRNCLPDGPKVGSGGALSPRGDWRMPADASPDVWIAEAERIPLE